MNVRWLVASIAMFILAAPAAHGTISAINISYENSVRFESQLKIFFDEVVTIEELTSGSYSEFQIPNWLHTPGRLHSAMYRYSRDGQSRLIKVILKNSPGYLSDKYFKEEVFGMLLSSHIGGPEVFRAGRFKAADGQIGFYVEMEELFAGASDTYTYKGIGSKTSLVRALAFRFPSDVQLGKIAKMIRLNLERGITISIDPDLIFSADDVRWIDTGQWDISIKDLSEKTFENEMALHNYGYLVTQFFRLKPRAGRILLSALREEIKSSKAWNQLQKTGILANLKTVMVNNWHWSETDYLGGAPEPELIIRKCTRFLTGS